MRWLAAAKKIIAEQRAKLAPSLQRVATAARGVLERLDSQRRGSTQRRRSTQRKKQQSRVESTASTASAVHAFGEADVADGGGGEDGLRAPAPVVET